MLWTNLAIGAGMPGAGGGGVYGISRMVPELDPSCIRNGGGGGAGGSAVD